MQLKKLRKKVRKLSKVIHNLFKKQPKLKFIYAWYYKYYKINDKQILFESFHGKDISDSPYHILNEVLKDTNLNNYDIYFSTNDYKKHKLLLKSMNLSVKLVDINSFKYTKVLATSKFLINNSSFPAYFIRKDKQIYLQTWHGTPLKTLGKKMRFGIESMYNVQHNFLQATHIMFPNHFTKKVIMEDYNLNDLYTGKVIMNGYPRNDIFSNQFMAKKVCDDLNNSNFTTFAYMPTWRGKSNHDIQIDGYKQEIDCMLSYLDNIMNDKQKIYVNFHPIVQAEMSLCKYKHIFPFPNNIDKYEFLNSIDVLITDYSSVFFDFSITRKPIILFMYDFDEYLHDRGLYFDIKELPFIKVYNIKDLASCILNEEYKTCSYSLDSNYIDKFLGYDSIDNAKNLKEFLFNGKNDLEIVDYSFNKEKKYTILDPAFMKTTEALDTISRYIDRNNQILIFKKNNFNPTLSSYLYDNYANLFNFVFITNTLPRTFIEDVLKRVSNKVSNKLQEREAKRIFSHLNVDSNFNKEYYTGEIGEMFYLSKSKMMVDCKIKSEKNSLVLKLDSLLPDYKIIKLVVIRNNRYILWTRNLTIEEQETGIIKEKLNTLFNDRLIKLNNTYIIAIEGVSKNNNDKQLFYIIDDNKFQKSNSKKNRLNKTSIYYEPLFFKNVYLNNNTLQDEIAILPFLNKRGYLSFISTRPEKTLMRCFKAQLCKIKTKKYSTYIKVKMPNTKLPIKKVILSYRSVLENINYSLDYNMQRSGNNIIFDINIDFSQFEFKELYWDIYIVLEQNGKEMHIPIFVDKLYYLKMCLMNLQSFIDDKHIVFPYKTKGNNFAFTYRLYCKYDTTATKFKELSAFAIYAILLPYWKKKKMWLVYEKFCAMAQDNGYYFFKYCMENLTKKENKNIYYILDKESSEWNKMSKYGKNVIPFMSFKHILYCMVAKMYVASDSKSHLYVWRPKPNLIKNRISKHKILFLQHGVTALKRVDGIFGKNGSSPMTYFTTTSTFEQRIVTDNFGYLPANAPVLGFTRWDVLEDKSSKDNKMILAMPTWRSWLEEKSPNEFKKSDYYKNYSEFLQNKKLINVLKNNNIKLIFYIHPKFKDYLNEFNSCGENIELVPFGKIPLNKLMMQCNMLITDYSSVCWDVYYMAKPVLFYQFDYQMYMEAHGSYLDMNKDLFGERYFSCDEIINGIIEYINNDFKLKDQYLKMIDYYFAYRDNNNSKRTYEFLINEQSK